jgi:predicted ester cyclase
VTPSAFEPPGAALEAARDAYRAALGGLRGEGLVEHSVAFDAPDVEWCGPHPFNGLAGRDGVIGRVWRPLTQAFAQLERRTDILIAGRWKGADWIASSGHLSGVFMADWLGVPAHGRFAWLRYGAFERFENGRVVEARWLFDLPSLMIQAGVWPLAPALGPDPMAPAPATGDGVVPAGASGGEASMRLVEAMIAGLMRYDGRDLATAEMARHWHPWFRWYGPAPIGSFAGLPDYERGHQRPFLTAFPDRVGGNHVCRIAEGAYVGSTGWPSVAATHAGGGLLGLAPTGKRIGMRVMDFWRREGGLLAENWVMIDLPDLLLQLGVDVFARVREMRA